MKTILFVMSLFMLSYASQLNLNEYKILRSDLDSLYRIGMFLNSLKYREVKKYGNEILEIVDRIQKSENKNIDVYELFDLYKNLERRIRILEQKIK